MAVPFAKQNELLNPPDPISNVGSDYVNLPGDHLILRKYLKSYVDSQLDMSRLNVIHDRLWRAGLPSNVQPLHHQKLRERNIVVTERVDLHLVWYVWSRCNVCLWGCALRGCARIISRTNLSSRMNDRIFIKPLPTFLLNYESYQDHITSDNSLHASALGFLRTYQNMIQYHIDFTMAQESGLIPLAVTWRAWNRFRMDLQTRITRSHQINKRYHYGELRLSRLNTIYRLYRRQWRGGYFLVHTRYQSFFRANFQWLILAFAYLSVSLSAFQVLLAADPYQASENSALRWISIVTGTASAVSVLIAVLIMAVLLVILRLVNEAFARSKRFRVEDDFELNEPDALEYTL